MQTLLDKLAKAGWIESSITVDKDDKNFLHTVKSTPMGRASLKQFFLLTVQIEQATKSKLTAEELAQLKGLAEIAQLKGLD